MRLEEWLIGETETLNLMEALNKPLKQKKLAQAEPTPSTKHWILQVQEFNKNFNTVAGGDICSNPLQNSELIL